MGYIVHTFVRDVKYIRNVSGHLHGTVSADLSPQCRQLDRLHDTCCREPIDFVLLPGDLGLLGPVNFALPWASRQRADNAAIAAAPATLRTVMIVDRSTPAPAADCAVVI